MPLPAYTLSQPPSPHCPRPTPQISYRDVAGENTSSSSDSDDRLSGSSSDEEEDGEPPGAGGAGGAGGPGGAGGGGVPGHVSKQMLAAMMGQGVRSAVAAFGAAWPVGWGRGVGGAGGRGPAPPAGGAPAAAAALVGAAGAQAAAPPAAAAAAGAAGAAGAATLPPLKSGNGTTLQVRIGLLRHGVCVRECGTPRVKQGHPRHSSRFPPSLLYGTRLPCPALPPLRSVLLLPNFCTSCSRSLSNSPSLPATLSPLYGRCTV